MVVSLCLCVRLRLCVWCSPCLVAVSVCLGCVSVLGCVFVFVVLLAWWLCLWITSMNTVGRSCKGFVKICNVNNQSCSFVLNLGEEDFLIFR